MFGLGLSEMVVLAILALVLIGPDKLPEIARNIARFLNELKRSTDDFTKDFKDQVSTEIAPPKKPEPPPPDVKPPPSEEKKNHE